MFNGRGTKIFTVHLHPQKRPLAEHAEFVAESFNWWAFLFTWIWAFSQRLWWVGGVLLVIAIAAPMLVGQHMLTPRAAFAIQLGLQLLMGFEGNDLRRRNLTKRGWKLSDIVAENSLLHAQQRYFARHASVVE